MSNLIILIFMLVNFVITFEMSMVMPLAPVISEYYSINPDIITLLNVGHAMSGFVSPIFGYLADKYGLKKMIVTSVLVFGIGSLLVSFGTKTSYFVGRFILGIGYYNLGSLSFTYSKITLTEEKLALSSGLYKLAFALGAFASPLLGATLVKYISFSDIYYILAISSLFLLLLIVFLPKAQVESAESLDVREASQLLKDGKATLMMLSAFLLSIPAVFFYNYLSLSLSAQSVSQDTISNLYSVVAFGSMCAGIFISFMGNKIGLENMAKSSAFLAGVFVLFLIFNNSSYVIAFIFGFFYDTIWGVFMPTGTSFYITKGATFLTLLSFVTSSTNIVTNILGPLLYGFTGFTSLLIICGISLISASSILKKAYELNKISHAQAGMSTL